MSDQIIKVLVADNEVKEKKITRLEERLKQLETENNSTFQRLRLAESHVRKLETRVRILLEHPRDLVIDFPDIHIHTNRWKQERLSSTKAIITAEEVEIRHNCGCCPDSPIELWPYCTYEGLRIYSDPCGITIGEANPFGGETPYADWQEKLRKLGFHEGIIEKVQAWFDANESEDSEGDE